MRKIQLRALLAGLVAVSGLACAEAPQPGPLATVTAIDLPRYMGKWYEFARFPNKFQAKCVDDVSAEYSQNPDGTVKVINRCLMDNGEYSEAVGKARQVGEPTSAKLQVSFAPSLASFIPWVWGDYWIIDIDPEYNVVAVGEPTREYLWVLTRTNRMSTAEYMGLLSRLRDKGYDTAMLIFSGPPVRK